MNCIEVKNVTKRFKDVTALNNVSLKFEGEKIYGLLGRNGAGKSTLCLLYTSWTVTPCWSQPDIFDSWHLTTR